jgi:hypothetical protein
MSSTSRTISRIQAHNGIDSPHSVAFTKRSYPYGAGGETLDQAFVIRLTSLAMR